MVWKRKKSTITADSSEAASLINQVNLAAQGSLAGEKKTIAALSPVLNQATNNTDAVGGIWASKVTEFELPVRSRPSLRAYVIPANYKVSGNIFSDRAVSVCGQFAEGQIEAPTVTVEAGGTLNGGVNVQTLRISGTSHAVVAASSGVEVSDQGTLGGRVTTPALKVWPGAKLLGAQIEVDPARPTSSVS